MRSEKTRRRASIWNVLILLLLLVLVLAACERPLQDVVGDGDETPTETAPQEAEATEAPPAEEEPTIAAPTEVAPTDAPATEVPPTEAPEDGEDESPRTGDGQEGEGEEATPEATAEPTDEAGEEATPEVTAEPTEEATAEATPEGDDGEQSAEEQIHVVQAGDNLYRIGLQYGISWTVLAEYNNLANANDLEVGQQIRIPPTEGAESGATATPAPQVTHVVQQGETVFIISQQYGVPWPDIADANDLTSPYTIYSGQTLVIPGGE